MSAEIFDFESWLYTPPPPPTHIQPAGWLRKRVQRATATVVAFPQWYRGMFGQRVPALAAGQGKSQRELMDMAYDRRKAYRALEDQLRFSRDFVAAADIERRMRVLENEIAQLDAMRGNVTALFQYRDFESVRSGMQLVA